MNSPEKMAEVRERFNLPEPDAEHECHAIQPGPSEREQHLSEPHACFAGQWVLHGPHDYETRVQKWLGGGTVLTHCPGKTPETVLG
jgi:hypothetical protein